jgi:exo-beta-1,3-glucanase (GH17 family)
MVVTTPFQTFSVSAFPAAAVAQVSASTQLGDNPPTSDTTVITPATPPSSSAAPQTPTTALSSEITSSSSSDVPPSSSAPVVVPLSAQPSATPHPQASTNDRFPIGVTYDPFTKNHGQSACKTEEQIRDEWSHMTNYGIVRIYGIGCGIVPIAVQLAKANNQRIFAGIYLTKGGDSEDIQTNVDELTKAVKNYAGGDWSIIALVSVENEQVNSKQFTASEVVDATNRGREALQFAGYNGPVGAVETAPALIDNPSICQNSDFAMANIHAFFDSNTQAKNAGNFVQNQVGMVRDACGGKRVIVTESGWPSQGDANGAAVPSPNNQKAAINSLQDRFDHDLFLFNAFDSPWKSDWAGSFNAERYWGILS